MIICRSPLRTGWVPLTVRTSTSRGTALAHLRGRAWSARALSDADGAGGHRRCFGRGRRVPAVRLGSGRPISARPARRAPIATSDGDRDEHRAPAGGLPRRHRRIQGTAASRRPECSGSVQRSECEREREPEHDEQPGPQGPSRGRRREAASRRSARAGHRRRTTARSPRPPGRGRRASRRRAAKTAAHDRHRRTIVANTRRAAMCPAAIMTRGSRRATPARSKRTPRPRT